MWDNLNPVYRCPCIAVRGKSRRRRHRESRRSDTAEYHIIPVRVVRLRERPAEIRARRIRQIHARRRDPRPADLIIPCPCYRAIVPVRVHIHCIPARIAGKT